MPYTVPPSKASIAQNRFEFQMPERDEVLSLPKLQYLRPSLIGMLDGGDKFQIIRGLLDAYHPGLFDEIEDADQLVGLYEAWAEASGIQAGESSASTDS